jgi:ankyrin repeat protein
MMNLLPEFDHKPQRFPKEAWTNNVDNQEENPGVVWGRPKILLEAVSKGRLRQLRLLLDAGINVNCKDIKSGHTALIRATLLENTKLRRINSKMLINYGAKVKIADHLGRTALSWACLLGRENSLRIFQSNPELDLAYDSVDKEGNTNLLLACISGNAHVVTNIAKAFHRNRLDVNRKNNQGESALSLVLKEGNNHLADILLDIAHATRCANPLGLRDILSAKHQEKHGGKSAGYARPSTSQKKPCNLPKLFNLYTEQLTQSYPRITPKSGSSVVKHKTHKLSTPKVDTCRYLLTI